VDLIGRVEAVHHCWGGRERVIRLDRGVSRSLGYIVARSTIAHRCVRLVARGVRRVCRLIGHLVSLQRRQPQESEPGLVEDR
jgi:hypothetical protein